MTEEQRPASRDGIVETAQAVVDSYREKRAFANGVAATGTEILLAQEVLRLSKAVSERGRWIEAHITPDTDREVLMLMKPRRNYERILIGRYEAWRAYWRPRGSNGNFADDIEGWQELPAERSDGGK